MHTELDNLIRAARPQLPAGALARASAVVAGAPASAPVFILRPMLRVAAVFALAFGVGIASAMLASPDAPVGGTSPIASQPDLSALRAELAAIVRNTGELIPAGAEAELSLLESRLDVLEARPLPVRPTLEEAIDTVIENRERRYREEWRERHLAFVRESYSSHLDVLVSDVRGTLVLSADQERRFREILVEHGEKAEKMIDSCYRRHHKRGSGFDQLARDTRQKLQAVLDEAQRNDFRVTDTLLGADPMHWAPREEFKDTVDMATYANWVELSK